MKTATAFLGSARRRGLTYTAVRRFLDHLERFGDVRGEIVFLSDYTVGVCRGCKACFERGEERCPLKDDRDLLIEKMKLADGVIFASPNYSFQVSGMMKVFLDRLGFGFHRPQFHGKTYTSLVAQGIHGGSKIVKYLDFVGAGLGFNVVKGTCITALEPMSENNRRQMEAALARHARRFQQQLLRPAFPSPSLFQLMVFRMGRTSIQQQLDESNRDFTFYRDHGWFAADYYYPARLSAMKHAAGAAFDRVAARLFKKQTA
jgi:multimeric flavodoxin WrbA